MADEDERLALGTERVGEPVANVVKTFVARIMEDELAQSVDPERMMEYVRRFLFGRFVEMIDRSTEDLRDLQAVSPEGVQQTVLLLLRDVLVRHLAKAEIPHEQATARVDTFIETLARELGIDADAALGVAVPLPVGNPEAPWAADAMEAVGLSRRHGLMLVLGHGAFVQGGPSANP